MTEGVRGHVSTTNCSSELPVWMSWHEAMAGWRRSRWSRQRSRRSSFERNSVISEVTSRYDGWSCHPE